MEDIPKQGGKRFRAKTRTVDLSRHWNWPLRVPEDAEWQRLAEEVRAYPTGAQQAWGLPFAMGHGNGAQAILLSADSPEVTVPLDAKADYLCFLHSWPQFADDVTKDVPREGLVVGEYELVYKNGNTEVLPVRARFEVNMARDESPGPPWLAVPFRMTTTVDPVAPPGDAQWGWTQLGLARGGPMTPLVCAIPNPRPARKLASLTMRGLSGSPLLVAGITLYRGSDNPLRHLPRRMYRVNLPDAEAKVEKVDLDLGHVARTERAQAPGRKKWLEAPELGTMTPSPQGTQEDLIEIVGAQDATVAVKLEGKRKKLNFSLGEAFHEGCSVARKARLEVLGKKRQWMRVRIVDSSTRKPTPVRIHFAGSRGEYIAPYGHHAQVNPNWFEDYGADLQFGGRNYAYVPGEFTTDMPVGDLYVEIQKGFEYEPVRRKVTIKPGQRELRLTVKRWKDLRSQGWVTADTHVHFLSPHTAWLEGQAEGVNVVNLLASQWGRLFTNVGDFTGNVGVVGEDTIVYVGTENRNHMLGHMSMLGTKGPAVFPMCCGGPGESHVGDPDFRMLAEWALENRRKGGVVIRPHYPYCGHTEDPVAILKGLVDALEIRDLRGGDFPTQEWYRYLNCGYRVAVCGGTDKMGAYSALGWMRTYAKLDADQPLTYDAWGAAVRAGRTVSTTGPLINLTVEGREIGDVISIPKGGASLEVEAVAESFWPLALLEVVVNGRVVAKETARYGARELRIAGKVKVKGSAWIAARCSGYARHPSGYMAAHTSPVYLQCGRQRLFDGEAALHMLGLVEGGVEYLNKLATVFDESSRKRMVKLFTEVQQELEGRLLVEAKQAHHHGDGEFHVHEHPTDHQH